MISEEIIEHRLAIRDQPPLAEELIWMVLR
jgi:hypothetical protein